MKKMLLFFSVIAVFIISNNLYSFDSFLYKSIALDDSGQLIPNSTIEVSISLYNSQGELFNEVHSDVKTDQFGIFTVMVGEGRRVRGDFDNIIVTADTRIEISTIAKGQAVLTKKSTIMNVLNSVLNSSWELEGNSGTTPGENFIGTTDNAELQIAIKDGKDYKNSININPNGSINRKKDGVPEGDKRGVDAVDLQIDRLTSNKVASGWCSVISGGRNNVAQTSFATVGGGWQNTAGESYSTVGGGGNNDAGGSHSTIAGGYENTAKGGTATIAGGSSNVASGKFTFIGGGNANTASESHAIVCGGNKNNANAEYAYIGGGGVHTIKGYAGVISGGIGNSVNEESGVVGGGNKNSVEAAYSTIGGGSENTTKGKYSTIAGGEDNQALEENAFIGGGNKNSIGAVYGIISGGRENTVKGSYATISGGYSNEADETYSFIGGGWNALADKYGQFAQANGSFEKRGDAQTSVLVLRITTDGEKSEYMYLDGKDKKKSLRLADGALWLFRIYIVAKNTDNYDFGGYIFTGMINRIDNSLTLRGVNHETIAYSSHIRTPKISTKDNALMIEVASEKKVKMRWVARVEITEVWWTKQ
jgi:hypothetical protein